MASNKSYSQYALSFGIQEYEGLWKLKVLHPYDAARVSEAWVTSTSADRRIGEVVEGVPVLQPGPRLEKVIGWFLLSLQSYPYYWPYEGTYIDKYGYDFEVGMKSDNMLAEVDISQIAYEIIEKSWRPDGDSETNPEIELEQETVDGGGALVKLSITLNHSQPVSEISMAPFTKYPMELVSIMYEEDTETHHPKKEILLPEENNTYKVFEQNTNTIRFQFPAVIAKRITLILRQKNYEQNTYLIRETSLGRQDLWEKISNREADVTLDLTDGIESISNQYGNNEIDEWSGWNIYLQELASYEADYRAWQSEVASYHYAMAERERAIDSMLEANRKYRDAMDEYKEKLQERGQLRPTYRPSTNDLMNRPSKNDLMK